MTATVSQEPAPAGDAKGEGRDWLGAGWVALPAESLPGLPGEPRAGERRFVLLHPAHGIAILDVWSSVAALPELEVAASLDAELALAGFLRRHDPRLPVRRIYLAQAALPQLMGVVARAYAGVPPLELPEGWLEAVRGSLAVPQKPAVPTARRMPRLRMAAAGIAGLLILGAVGLLAAGGPVGQRAQPVPEGRSAATTLAAAVPAPAAPAAAEPALSPAPPAARSAAAPPPVATEPAPALRADPASVAVAPVPAGPALPAVPPPRAASAGPLAAAAPAALATAPLGPALPPAPPPALGPAPVMPPDPARAAEGPIYGPAAAPPRSARRQPRPARRAASARSSPGRAPQSGGSFIRQQSLQYATGNGS